MPSALCRSSLGLRAPRQGPQTKEQECSVPRTSHGQTAHPTALIHSHSLTWGAASTWVASKLCLSVPQHQTRLEIISGDGEGAAPGKILVH